MGAIVTNHYDPMQARQTYVNLQHTLKAIKRQVEDSLPFIEKYIPNDIRDPQELFYFLRDKVVYRKDPKGVELLQTVQSLIDDNWHGIPGAGDCDCFTILSLAAFQYLGFEPSQVALVGRKKSGPSHIYTLVYDPSKKKMCAFDLTNPYYCMERKYKYRQILDFMILQLHDGFYPLAGKTQRRIRKAAKQEAKTKRKAAKQARKVAKAENKTARKIARQERRTDRVNQKGERKAAKRAVKVAKKDKKLIRVKGKTEIMQARQQNRLNNVVQPQSSWDSVFEPAQMDVAPMPQIPGGAYQPDNADDWFNYEQMPEEEMYPDEFYPEEEYEEEFEVMEDLAAFPFIPAAVAAVKKAASKVKASKVGQAVTRGASKYDEITRYKQERDYYKGEAEREARNKYVFGGTGGALGLLAGILIGRATK